MKRTGYLCPSCNETLQGRIIGPKVEHRLSCMRCHWTGNTESLQKIYKARFQMLLQAPGVLDFLKKLPPTEFVGYDTLSCTCDYSALD